MLIKVFPIDIEHPVHLWTYRSFQERLNGVCKGHEISGNLILSKVYDIPQPFDPKILKEYGLDYAKV